MSVTYVEQVFDVALSKEQIDGKLTSEHLPRYLAQGVDPVKSLKAGERVLRCIVGLLGETEPVVIPATGVAAISSEQRLYRYDWIFGISIPPNQELYWDWKKALRSKESFVVQLLIAPGKSGCGFTELSTDLVALHPSKESKSWIETHRDQLARVLTDGAALATQAGTAFPTATAITSAVGAILQTASVLTNFISSGEGANKNWYIYRFLDAEEKCCAVEWKINRNVLEEYGPLLRGSILIAFHGATSDNPAGKEFTITLRPGLGFSEDDLLQHVRPTMALDRKEQPKLFICPKGDS